MDEGLRRAAREGDELRLAVETCRARGCDRRRERSRSGHGNWSEVFGPLPAPFVLEIGPIALYSTSRTTATLSLYWDVLPIREGGMSGEGFIAYLIAEPTTARRDKPKRTLHPADPHYAIGVRANHSIVLVGYAIPRILSHVVFTLTTPLCFRCGGQVG